MKHYKRFFAFGCSFTKYHWPTWADIVADQTKLPYFNYGINGLGNVGILHRLLEADLTYTFTPDDLILVMWTHWSREDRYINNNWKVDGNVFANTLYDKSFIKKYWDWDNDIIKNSAAILLANRSFNIADQYSILDYGSVEIKQEPRPASTLWDFYVPRLPRVSCFTYNDKESCFYNLINDGHPDIIQHSHFYNTHIAPKLGFELLPSENKFSNLQQQFIQQLEREHWSRPWSAWKDSNLLP